MLNVPDELDAHIDHLNAECDRLRAELQEVRRSHARFMQGIKALLGYTNWPTIPGVFNDGVLKLLEARLTSR